uniref:Restriction endonuclease type IV Mrr domain-containing protein n=1 Tax=Sulfobacillus thermotolerans TaxID=338644 RepID=G5CIX2_9FIRM|nr:restriction endonuclease [Sulfobacillus thermotolerans]AEP14249.1 conserved hypothetical protein [Sulfobacillus thermotolerans]
MQQPFPKDIVDAMRDCILAVLWPKSDIIDFFKNNGCTPDDLRDATMTQANLNRSQIIDAVFLALYKRKDGGIGQFRSMLKALTEWKWFSPYYFKTLGKLNEDEAIRRINHLKQIQEIRDAKIRTEREAINARQKQEVLRSRSQSLDELRKDLLQLYQAESKLTHQQRGYAFETVLLNIARYSGLIVTEPFRVQGEQIDGAIKFDGENYVIEAKWQDRLTASNALYNFAYKIEGKMYGRGLFVSANGFEENAVIALITGKTVRTILIDGADLVAVVEGRLTYNEMLDVKIKAAQTKGWIYIDPLTGQSKV